jgi:hypothetical protein
MVIGPRADSSERQRTFAPSTSLPTVAETLSELASRPATEPAVSPAAIPLLSGWTTRQGLTDALAVPALGRSPSAAEIFNALLYAPDGAVARQIRTHFEVVAAPNALLVGEVQSGDVLLRAGGGHGNVSIVASSELYEIDAALARGWRPEDRQTGYYAEVIEGGPRPHPREQHFARRILDATGKVPPDQLILRPSGSGGAGEVLGPRTQVRPVEVDSPDTEPAEAFVLDNFGRDYFNTFPRLGTLSVQRTTILDPPLFENLIDKMLASTERSFVIDAHGVLDRQGRPCASPDEMSVNPSQRVPCGLSMKLARNTNVSTVKPTLFMLWAIERIRFLMAAAEKEATIWERASGDFDPERWQRILEVIHSNCWHHMIGDPWPTEVPRVTSVEEARKILTMRTDSLVNALFPGQVGDKAARVDRLIEKMQSLQSKGIRQVQFRACNMGKDPEALSMFRTFLGANLVCAPDVRSGIKPTTPQIGRAHVDRLLKHPLAQSYDLPSGRFVIIAKIVGEDLTPTCAADSQQAAVEWVEQHLMAGSAYRRGPFPVHLLELTPRAFPLDDEYARHIKCRSSLWEQALRTALPDVSPAARVPGPLEDAPTPAPAPGAASVVGPFPTPDPTALIAANAALAGCVNAVSDDPRVRDLCSGLIDLTAAPGDLPYIGHNDTDMLYVGSIAKIYPFLAAFTLRERVSLQAQSMIDDGLSTTKSGWQQRVFDALRSAWQPLLDARFPKHPKGGHPDFKSILTIGTDGSATFLPSFIRSITDATGNNDEAAAGHYIRALSYPYINGALAAAGFFDETTQNGLWISGDYNGNDWKPKDGAAVPLTAGWQLPAHKVSNFAGTARQISRFIGLMAVGKLVMSASASEMTDLLGVPWLSGNLAKARPPPPSSTVAGKVGIGTWDGRTHDAAIVSWVRDPAVAARTIHYAVVVLGSDRSTSQLTQLELGFHDCIVGAHP